MKDKDSMLGLIRHAFSGIRVRKQTTKQTINPGANRGFWVAPKTMKGGFLFCITVLLLSVCNTPSFARQGGKKVSIPEAVIESIYNEVKTPYEYGYFLTGGLPDLFPPTNVPMGKHISSDVGIVGNPIVFRIPEDKKYVYMSFTYHDGIGYQTGLARSKDFVTWEAVGVMIDNKSYNRSTNWDKYHAGGYIMRDHVWGKTPYPHRVVVDGPYKGLYSMTYLGSNKPYSENGNVSQGMAFSDKIFEKDGSVAKWWRYEKPILSPNEGYAYEAGACWKSEAIWDEKNNRYAIFYNASRRIPERLCQAYSKDLIHWEREPSNPVIGPEKHNGYLWGNSHSGDPDVVKIGDYWVIFYFSTTPKGIVDVFAVSTDMVHWQQSFRPLLTCNSTWASKYAHKPCVIKQNGVVYHYYVAYGNRGYISAVNTSIDLSVLKTALAIPEGKYPKPQYEAIQNAIKNLQNRLLEEDGSLELVEKAIKNLKDAVASGPVAFSDGLRWQNGALYFGNNIVGKLSGEMPEGIVIASETFAPLGDNTFKVVRTYKAEKDTRRVLFFPIYDREEDIQLWQKLCEQVKSDSANKSNTHTGSSAIL